MMGRQGWGATPHGPREETVSTGPLERESRVLFIGQGGPTRREHAHGIRGTGSQNQGSVAQCAIQSDLSGVAAGRLA